MTRLELLRAWLVDPHANAPLRSVMSGAQRHAFAQHARNGDRPPPLAWRDTACPGFLAARRPRVAAGDRRPLLRASKAAGSHRGRKGYVCPALSSIDSHRSIVAAMVAQALLAPATRVVLSGIDTLELSTRLPLGAHLVHTLEALFDEVSSGATGTPVEIGGLDFTIHPRHVRGGWKLQNPAGDVVLRVMPLAEIDHPTAIVELHAAALWALGWEEAAETARRVLAAAVASADPVMEVQRVDLCADFQGWIPCPDDSRLFTTRAKKIGRYREGLLEPVWGDDGWIERQARDAIRIGRQLERATGLEDRRRLLEALLRPSEERTTWVEYSAGKLAFSGFAFGLGGAVAARVYDKTREIRVSRKQWFCALWERERWNAERPVWRAEFQLRREALKQFVLTGEHGWTDLTHWDDFKERLPDVWRYLSKNWLRHGHRTKEDRQALSRAWATVRDAAFEVRDCPELARIIPEVGVQPVVASLAGYLSTAAGQLLERDEAQVRAISSPAGVEVHREAETQRAAPDFGAVMTSVLAAAYEYTERTNEMLELRAGAKAKAIHARRRFLDQRDRRREQVRSEKAREAVRLKYDHEFGRTFVWTEDDDAREERTKRWRAELANRSEPPPPRPARRARYGTSSAADWDRFLK